MGKISDAFKKLQGQEEKREHKRVVCLKQVNFDTQDYSYNNQLLNISEGGAFIKTSEAIAMGQEIELTLFSQPQNLSFKITAKVVKRRKDGIGVEFKKLTQTQSEMLNAFVREI